MNFNPVSRRFNLRKCVHAPTRGANVLDQSLTNMSTMYNDVTHLPPLAKFRPPMLTDGAQDKSQVASTARKKVREMKPGNFVQLTIKLNQKRRNNVFESASTDGKVEDFTSTLISILNTTMPMKTVKVNPSDKPWMTTRIKLKIKERQIIRCYTNGDMQRYQLLREEVSSLVATAKAYYNQNKASGLHKTDPVRYGTKKSTH